MADKDVLVDPESGDSYCIGGCLVSDEPSDLPTFGASREVASKDLPPVVDLRQLMTPVEEQGQLNSCVGNALAGAYEFLIMKNSKKHVDVSRLFIYYNGRVKDGLQEYNMQDRGTYIHSAIAALAEFGCCKESSYPYNPSYANRKPPQQCYKEAINYRTTKTVNIKVNLDEMKACIAEGYPFAFGIQLFQSFLQAGHNGGRVTMPLPHESQAAKHGCHAMLAVGYSDPSQCFIVRNSWGEKWGDKGYCYIPYAYMANPQYCSDLHAIQFVADDSRRQRDEQNQRDNQIHNPYNWNAHKDKRYYVPSNYPYQDFHYTFFWKNNDMFNYFNSIWQNGQVIPYEWKKAYVQPNVYSNPYMAGETDDSPRWFILWIDKRTDDNSNVVRQIIREKDVNFDFCETLSEAENHIMRHVDKIRSSSTFQIICRGYYRQENKNPLNLLQFLNNQGLHRVPVLVFTQDKSGLLTHLQRDAPSMGINDWQQRLFITSTSEKIVNKCKENMVNM